jgi:hypothetical protein
MLISTLGLPAVIALVLAAAAQSEGAAPTETPAAPDFGSDQATEDASAEKATGKKKGKKHKGDQNDGDQNAAPTARADDLQTALAAAQTRIEWKGRVFFLGEYRDEVLDAGGGPVADSGLTLSLPSARAGFKATVRDKVTVVIEADFAGGRVSIRDGYLQAKNKRFMLRAGRFKMPLFALTLESPWRLPRAQRGVLDDVLTDRMLLAGRREGLMGRFEGGGFWDVAVTAGVFQSPAVNSPAHLTSVLRLSIEPRNTEIALVGQRRSALVGGVERAFNSGGIDLTSISQLAGLGLRVWGEAYVGESWYHHPAAGVDEDVLTRGPAATYVQTRGLAAVRRGGVERDDRYAELFLSGGVLDPDTGVRQDLLVEVSAGINIGQWETTRLTFEVVRVQSGRNIPDSIFLDAALPTVVRRNAALLQLGAAF